MFVGSVRTIKRVVTALRRPQTDVISRTAELQLRVTSYSKQAQTNMYTFVKHRSLGKPQIDRDLIPI